jgi:GAF domain-containing protein
MKMGAGSGAAEGAMPVRDVETQVRDIVESKAGLREKLDELVRVVEDATPSGMLASILILDEDGRHLRHGAAPSLPDAYNAAIDGLEIGPEVGSCGTAAFHDKTVSVYDIETDALWRNFKELALAHGLRACWSSPIHAKDGRVVGTFANYYRVVRDPSPVDVGLTERIKDTAAELIEASRRRA